MTAVRPWAGIPGFNSTINREHLWNHRRTRKESERKIAAEVREYVSTLAGSFSTRQLYTDLGIFDPTDKATAQKALERIRRTIIEPDGERAGQFRIPRSYVIPCHLHGAGRRGPVG